MKTKSILAVFFIAAQILFAQNNEADSPLKTLNFQPLPGLNMLYPFSGKTTDVFLIGVITGVGHNLKGLAFSPIGSINNGYVRGVQLSGLFNFSFGDISGIQISGLFNFANKNMKGIQIAPLNIRNEGDGVNLMVGLVNISKSENVIPIGLVNRIEGGLKNFYVYMDDSSFLNLGYRSGTKIFFTHSEYGFGGGFMPGKEGDNYILFRGGFGFEFSLGNFFIDIDLTRGNVKSLNNISFVDFLVLFFGSNTNIYQLRLTGRYKIYKRLGVFAGISCDYFRRNKPSDPSPHDFVNVFLGSSLEGDRIFKMGFFGGVQF